MPYVLVDSVQLEQLQNTITQLQSNWVTLQAAEALEHRHITERIPLIACSANPTVVDITPEISAISQIDLGVQADIITEQEHIQILNNKLDECGIPELT